MTERFDRVPMIDQEPVPPRSEALGDQRWMEVLREHNAIVREQLATHDGFEVKSEVDVLAKEVVAFFDHLTRVEAHPNADRLIC